MSPVGRFSGCSEVSSAASQLAQLTSDIAMNIASPLEPVWGSWWLLHRCCCGATRTCSEQPPPPFFPCEMFPYKPPCNENKFHLGLGGSDMCVCVFPLEQLYQPILPPPPSPPLPPLPYCLLHFSSPLVSFPLLLCPPPPSLSSNPPPGDRDGG